MFKYKEESIKKMLKNDRECQDLQDFAGFDLSRLMLKALMEFLWLAECMPSLVVYQETMFQIQQFTN